MRTVIYPGSFDPITFGHLDVVGRAAKLFDRVIVAVADNYAKDHLFSIEERRKMVYESIKPFKNVSVDCLSGLLVDFVTKNHGDAVIRGLRAISDFEFEFQLALTNRKLDERVETIFMMPKDIYTFLSSKIVKEIARLGGEVKEFVPPHVERALRRRLGTGRNSS